MSAIPLNIPNILTIGRILMLVPMMILFFLPFAWAAWTVLFLYTLGAVTDWLDGWIARKFDQGSEFGRFLDPISDKIFVVTILLMLVAVDRISGILVVGVAIIIVREFIVSGLREFLGPKDVKMPVTVLAKWKTTIQMVATGILIVGPYIGPAKFFGDIGLAGAAAITAYTGWLYLKSALPHMKEEGKGEDHAI
ncbi:MAG: CDP-diacylglycerol--glycerol-3-phosphate 3-phosphatidyltransferase [Micavibrio aeruginosavorus]|uniref:CDP-diacylglycerol--glycerol-3-phosphate 3-phosphatidyltransferase n=1 Tax=Micavibrio aeruginosavorus TaxID=349221 RepID=A0A7T5R1N5_9BACT|nr:MAG: CDP-diacylglycerol--glycerol-3-phosphate 3-phosphatidyltransferase [Micavibrio aeruginosavorus]